MCKHQQLSGSEKKSEPQDKRVVFFIFERNAIENRSNRMDRRLATQRLIASV